MVKTSTYILGGVGAIIVYSYYQKRQQGGGGFFGGGGLFGGGLFSGNQSDPVVAATSDPFFAATIAADNDPTTDEDIGVAPQSAIPGVTTTGVQVLGGTRGAGTVEYQIGRETALLGSGSYNVPKNGYTGRQLESLVMGAASVNPGSVVKPGIYNPKTGLSEGGSLNVPDPSIGGRDSRDSMRDSKDTRTLSLAEATRTRSASIRERDNFDRFGDE